MTYLLISGKDAERFLQAQTTNDIRNINQGIYTAFLSPQAQIKALTYLLKSSENIYYLISANAIELKSHLEKFIILEDCKIEIRENLPENFDLSQIVLENYSDDDNLIKLGEAHQHRILDKYVSFSKGCFPGQEVLAKYKNIGLKKRSEKLSQKAMENFARASSDTEIQESIDMLKAALKEYPKNEEAYEVLGVIFARQGQYQKAVMLMHQLETINPKSIMAQTNLSIFYMKLGDKERAEEHKAKGTVLQFDQALRT